jgi:acyl dehydratase
MQEINYEDIQVGDELPGHVCGPITRTTLGLFAGGSGDHNPIHIDIDFAKKFGMDDVFAHGMLSMAYLVQILTNWVDQHQLREYGVRFTSITPVLATVTCEGRVTEKLEIDGERCLKIDVTARIDDGTQTLLGDAIVGFRET